MHKSVRALKGPAKIKWSLRGLHLDLTTDNLLQLTSESRINLAPGDRLRDRLRARSRGRKRNRLFETYVFNRFPG
jgi:hypothetical protein